MSAGAVPSVKPYRVIVAVAGADGILLEHVIEIPNARFAESRSADHGNEFRIVVQQEPK